MALTARNVLLVIAVVLFALAAALPTQPTRIALTPAGLAFLTAALIVSS